MKRCSRLNFRKCSRNASCTCRKYANSHETQVQHRRHPRAHNGPAIRLRACTQPHLLVTLGHVLLKSEYEGATRGTQSVACVQPAFGQQNEMGTGWARGEIVHERAGMPDPGVQLSVRGAVT